MAADKRPVMGFLVAGRDGVAIYPYETVVEMLERNAASAGPANLKSSAAMRDVADSFRSWARSSEPGWLFAAVHVGLSIIRLATYAPIYDASPKKPKVSIVGPPG